MDAQGEHAAELVSPGFNLPEFVSRLINTWWLSYAFWVAGTIMFFHLRPVDVRRNLLVAFSYLTAIWFMAGSISGSTVYYSAVVLRVGIWLSLPVYLHLHWHFPKPFRKLPALLWWALYALGIAMAMLSALQIAPAGIYGVALLLAVLGSLLLLLIRLVRQPEQRREVGILLLAVVISLVPVMLLSWANAIGVLANLSGGVVISLIIWPGAYLYVVYRRQLGGLELRANRLISFYLFFVLLFIIALVLVPLLSPYLQSPEQVAASILITGLLVSLFNVYAFERFQRFVERKLLHIPMPPERLQHSFAGKLSTSFTRQNLAEIVQQQVLPSLLIRQSALLHLGSAHPARQVVYLQGVDTSQVPDSAAIAALLAEGGQQDPEGTWVQLAIPMHVSNRPVGLWLLGRKDPDDYYSYAERRLLQSLADQMAIALINIEQADNLRALHQRSIDDVEARRAFMARELHDDVLAGINELVSLGGQPEQAARLQQHHEALSDRVRQLIYRLRPAMLDYGLYRALIELVDVLSRDKPQVQVSLLLPESDHAYEEQVAQHAYRIVQLAAENVFKHAQAQFLTISGQLEPDCIDLLIEDDGRGFDAQGAQLTDLLRTQHYGLASMSERAALIGAELSIESQPGAGTQVRLVWRKS